MKDNKASGTMIGGFIIMAVLVLVDQLTKYWAATRLKTAPIVLIPGVFELSYTENRGAAFGIMQNATFFFLAISVILIGVIVMVLKKIPDEKRYHPLTIGLFVMMAGATGNMLDRMINGYVVDFLYFSLINFPLFNVADICVVCSVILMFILLLFVYRKEEDLSFLIPKKEEKEDDGKGKDAR